MNLSLILAAVPAAPHAYIDPNTGGMLFQLLAVFLALFSGILFFFSRQIKDFFARIRRMRRGSDEDEPASEPVDEQKPE
jgi:hypothetical protein